MEIDRRLGDPGKVRRSSGIGTWKHTCVSQHEGCACGFGLVRDVACFSCRPLPKPNARSWLPQAGAGKCRSRNQEWASADTLFGAALRVCPRGARIRNNVGTRLLRARKYAQSRAHFEVAVDSYPHFALALHNRGLVDYFEGHGLDFEDDLHELRVETSGTFHA